MQICQKCPFSLFFAKTDGHSNAKKDVRENKTALQSESRMECNKGKKYSFLCPIFWYTMTGKNAQGSIYG